MSELTHPSRRGFIKHTALAGAAAVLLSRHARAAEIDPNAPILVGLIGSGRRGNGAARDCAQAHPGVRIVAQCDLFPDALADSRTKLATLGAQYAVTDDTAFSGFDAYKQVIAADVDMVILATPPAYRAAHLRAAIEAGRHVFMEKPAGTDPQQVKSVIESGEMAAKKGLSIVAGTQRRHSAGYREVIQRIHDGAIGDILSASCYWVGDYGYYPAVLRQDAWSDMEYHNRNWNYFTWIGGDHIVEQHVHNLDIMNWVLGAHPIKAIGMGGRSQRTGPEFGHIYDHFSVEYEYPNEVRVQSLCRQNADTYSRVGEHVVGSKGNSDCHSRITGENKHRQRDEDASPYVQEHAHLIAAILANEPINEAKQIAESTMTAVIGRMAAYTGQEVEWDWAMTQSKEDLLPNPLQFGPLPTPEIAIPGKTPLV
jgi:predicted dehydrogenase